MANCFMEELILSYHELNNNIVEELEEEPSALEFMRYVAKNRPFVVRKGIVHWKATQRWNSQYLQEIMGTETINVAITPHG